LDGPLDCARLLRKHQTDVESRMWAKLRNRRFDSFKCRRQVPIGSYIVDFVCFDRRLIIELDGGQHTLQVAYDRHRTIWFERQGFRVLRFWNHEVLVDTDAVEELIWRMLNEQPEKESREDSRRE
jgi:very-short-patch-repair endonuclease